MCKSCNADFDSPRHRLYMRLNSFAAVGSGVSIKLLDALEDWVLALDLGTDREEPISTPTPRAE